MSFKTFIRRLKSRALEIVIVLMVFFLIFLFFAPSIVITVNSGEAGVLFRRLGSGTITTKYYDEGVQFIFPWDIMYIYDVRLQERSKVLDVLTKDGLMVSIEVSARFSPNINTIGILHKHIGPDYVEKVVMPEVEAETRNIISQYDVEQLYTNDRRIIQQVIADSVLDNINNQIIVDSLLLENNKNDRYVIFEDLFLESIRLPDLVASSIEKKIEAEHKFLTYEYLILAEEQEKIRKQIEAQGIDTFQQTAGIDILKWRGLEVTEKLSQSPNSKIILLGTDDSLPIILNGETNN